MVEKSPQCVKHDYGHNRQDDDHIFSILLDSKYHNDQWHTSTKDAFSVPELTKMHPAGCRRNLIRTILSREIAENLANEMNVKPIIEDSWQPSEYNDKFGDPKFIPFMDKLDTPINKLMAYPLYACNNQTFYKEQLERGGLKLHSEISNLNEPFRRNCAFTTSPDHAFREPTGGY